MTGLEILRIPVLQDNYVWLLRDPPSGRCAVVDPALAAPVLDALEERGWRLDFILNTHHHGDHVGGNLALKRATGARVFGPECDRARIPGLDVGVADGDLFALGSSEARVSFVPGHTRGHIAWHFAESRALFCGDTLFLGGCGRLFEGTPAQMRDSLCRLAALPPTTRVYCAHEYTLNNLRFAHREDPEDQALAARLDEVTVTRERGEPTVPGTLAVELATNPFLRTGSVEAFAELRRRKDAF